MTQSQSINLQRTPMQFEFSDAQFDQIAGLAHRKFGLCLPATKKALVYSRLSKRLRALGLKDFGDYCKMLEDDTGNEHTQLLTSLTTNVTQFFREKHHFDTLRDKILPPLLKKARLGEAVRIWSAGCSSGEEPYSIALTILETAPDAAQLDLQIVATDIDPTVLKTAQRAEYASDALASAPGRIGQTDVFPMPNGMARLSDRVTGMVAFSELNLVADWPKLPAFDVIFCRNVAIYFDTETKARLWNRFRKSLRPSGALFIGHSERLDPETAKHFRTIGVTAFAHQTGHRTSDLAQRRPS